MMDDRLGHWTENLKHQHSEWREQVALGYTLSGYHDWLATEIAIAKADRADTYQYERTA